MSSSSIESLKIRAKLLQKSKKKLGKDIPLKEALSSIATSMGYKSWTELKQNYETSDLLNPPRWSSQWKVWYSQKDEAQKNLTPGHYILPHLKQYFVCDHHYLADLGIASNDPDLMAVGNDFSAPKSAKAWTKLLDKIKAHLK